MEGASSHLEVDRAASSVTELQSPAPNTGLAGAAGGQAPWSMASWHSPEPPTKGRVAIIRSLVRGASCASLCLLLACGSESTPDAPPPRPVPSVEAVQARHGALPLTQRLSGVVRAKNQIAVYPQIAGVVSEVLVTNGESVREGQVLLRLRDTEFRERAKQAQANHRIALAQLRRAKAQAREARAEYERFVSLEAKELSSRVDLDAALARTESADADVQLAEARIDQALASAQEQEENLAHTVVRASIDGAVGGRVAEVGMLVGPSTRIFTLGQLDSVIVDVVLTDRMLAFIEPGQRAELRVGEEAISAPLARISPFLHPVSHSTEAEIDVENPEGRLKPGMFVGVDVFYGESEQATLVPLSALYEHPATGVVGMYVTRETFDREPLDEMGVPTALPLTEPVSFEFVEAEVVAQGHQEAAVRGVDPDTWVITLGQNLLAGEDGDARVRPVQWEWVERLQRLQREDLMEDVIERRASR